MDAQQEVASFALALRTARTASKTSQRDIAARLFRRTFIDSWCVPAADWLERRMK